MSDVPKSSFDIVMERLRKKDAESGTEQTPLTDVQRTAIAEARKVYEAQVAERKIMHRSNVASVFEPSELAERESELRRDLDRFERERDKNSSNQRAVNTGFCRVLQGSTRFDRVRSAVRFQNEPSRTQ